jgi:hypothetical protein
VLRRETVSETWRGARHSLMLERYPVGTITSVTVDGVLAPATDYELDGSFLYRLCDDERVAWTGAKSIVVYAGGYNPIPADLSRACLDLAVNLSAVSGRDSTIRSVNIADVESVSFRDEANGGGVKSQSVIEALNLYRDYRL